MPPIHAELSEYTFMVYLDADLITRRDSIVCDDVYIITGQSNANALDYESRVTYQSEWLRSFGSATLEADECAADTTWGLAQGQSIYTHMAIGVWGLRLGQLLVETYEIPICILNGAKGGSPIEQHLRSESLSTHYGRLLYRTIKAGAKDGIKAILWHQGESNTGEEYIRYADNFDELYNAWHEDYPALKKIYGELVHYHFSGFPLKNLLQCSRHFLHQKN